LCTQANVLSEIGVIQERIPDILSEANLLCETLLAQTKHAKA
jgi:hypothetical protein